MIVSFPHNPTTAIATPELMQRLVDLAREREFVLVHDFAYADIAFDGHVPPSVLAADGALDCAVELYSLTKSFSMAGWRMGFTIGRPDVVAALAKLKSYLDYGTFQPIQIASIVALREASEYPLEVCEIYRGRRDALISGLARAGWDVEPPKGTMFVWAPIPEQVGGLGSLECAVLLAREARGRGQPRHRLRRRRRRPRPLRARRERAADPAGDALDPAAASRCSESPPLRTPSRPEPRTSRTRRAVLRRRRRPPGHAALDLLVRNVEVEAAVLDVEDDRVAVADGRERAAADASGAMWPTIRPCVAPEKRPSVIRATSSPSPSPTSAAVTCSISRIPGPPAGPS